MWFWSSCPLDTEAKKCLSTTYDGTLKFIISQEFGLLLMKQDIMVGLQGVCRNFNSYPLSGQHKQCTIFCLKRSRLLNHHFMSYLARPNMLQYHCSVHKSRQRRMEQHRTTCRKMLPVKAALFSHIDFAQSHDGTGIGGKCSKHKAYCSVVLLFTTVGMYIT